MSNEDSFVIRNAGGVGWGNELKTDFVKLATVPNGHHVTKNQQGEEELFLQLPSGGTVVLKKVESARAWAWIQAHAVGRKLYGFIHLTPQPESLLRRPTL